MTGNNTTIYSQRLAGRLMTKGFILLGIEPEKNCTTGKNVFFFKDTPALRAEIEAYKSEKMK